MNDKDCILIPVWIKDTLVKNGYSLDSVLSYVKLKEILNTEDISELLGLQKSPLATMLGISEDSLKNRWLKYADSVSKVQIENLSPNSNASQRLSEKTSTNETKWAIADIDRNYLAIVLDYSVAEDLADKNKFLELLRAVLKVFYGIDSVHEVSKKAIFKQYLNCLNNG